MKSLSQLALIVFVVVLFTQCTKENNSIEPKIEATILGEWKLQGFENVRYHFTEDKRFTIYGSSDTTFAWPTLEAWRTENPQLRGLDWHYEGNEVVIDLNFGNIQRITPEFKCNNNVVSWTSTDGMVGEKYYRANHDIGSCN